MAVIGLFKPTKAGGWEGKIRTLTLNLPATIAPNDNRRSDNSPDFLVTSTGYQIGAAWRRERPDQGGRMQLNIQFDDPCLPQSVSATLIADEDHQSAKLFWNSKKYGEGNGH